MFWNPVGLGFNTETLKIFQYAEEHSWARVANNSRQLGVRMINDHHVITYEYSVDQGKTWKLFPTRMEVSGIHHNVFGGFLSLKVGLYCVGTGKVQIRDFRYKALG